MTAWTGLIRMRASPPLAVQIMALLVGGLVVAQAATLGLSVLLPPAPPPQYRLQDIAAALRGADADKSPGRVLVRTIRKQPPSLQSAGWLVSERSRRQLANLLGVEDKDVRLLFYSPLPFAGLGELGAMGLGDGPRVQSAFTPAPLGPATGVVLRAAYGGSAMAGPSGAPAAGQARGAWPSNGGGSVGASGGWSTPPTGSHIPIPIPPSPPSTPPQAQSGPGLPSPAPSAPPQGASPQGASPQDGSPQGASPQAASPQGAQGTPTGAASQPDAASHGEPAAQAAVAPPGGASAGTPSSSALAPSIAAGAPGFSPPGGLSGGGPGQGLGGLPGSAAALASGSLVGPLLSPGSAGRINSPAIVDPEPQERVHTALKTGPQSIGVLARPFNAGVAASPTTIPLDSSGMIAPAPLVAARTGDTAGWIVSSPELARTGLFGLGPPPFVQGDFVAAVQTRPGQWVTVEPKPEPFPTTWQKRIMLWFVLAFAVVGPVGWLFAQSLARPLDQFSSAAERLGRDPSGVPAKLVGPAEIGRAARAFNAMQTRLKRFVDDRTAMVGAISHDLRTPLARMRFRMERAPDELKVGMLNDITQMEEMISSVLVFIRDASEPSLRERVDLRSILECVVDDAALMGGAASLEVGDPLSVEVDTLGVQRVLANLVDNALKYGHRADVRMYAEDGDAVAEVIDDGPGLPPEELERVFLPFYRSEAARTLNKGGIGLGLAVSRSIARAHGGDIRLMSEGEGVKAQLRLPLALKAA